MILYFFWVLVVCSSRVFGFLLSDQDNTSSLNYQNECTKESHVDNSMVKLAKQFNRITNNGDLDEFASCILQKFKIMNNDGTVNQYNCYSLGINIDNLKLYIQLTQRCKHERSSDAGEKARKILNCFLKAGELLTPYNLREN